MTNSKKNSKSIIALVVMALLLVASIVLAATGAWFTQIAKPADDKTISFGKVDVTVAETGFGFARGETAVTEKLMPGDKINAKLTLTNNNGDEPWVVYKINVTINGTDVSAMSSFSDPVKLSTISDGVLDASVTLDGEKYGNLYEEKEVTVSYEVRMVQSTNVSAEDAKTILNAADFEDTCGATYPGKTV